MNNKIITAILVMLAAMGFFIWAFPIQTPSINSAPEHAYSQTITAHPRPLVAAADRLQQRYGKIVTYEETLLVWNGDLEPGDPGTSWSRSRTFTLPAETDPKRTPVLDLALLTRVLNAYHTQTDGPRFKLSVSRWGLHIIPAQVRDVSGRFSPVVPVLDTSIEVPVAKRSPSQHLRALCEALSVSSGSAVRASCPYMDGYFAPNEIFSPAMTERDKEQLLFSWGASNVSARDALIDLLDGSSTSMTWRLLCGSEGSTYTLNILPIQVVVQGFDGQLTKQTLSYDRCKKCPPLPGKKK
jgi:hypothetical protein